MLVLSKNANGNHSWATITDEEVVTGIIAYAGGGQANATQLTYNFNEITTVATALDSVKLPAGATNGKLTVFNDGANIANVYPYTSGTINDGSANAPIPIAPGVTMIFTFITDTNCEANQQVLETNIIKEQTSGSGVTIDSFLCKDGYGEYGTNLVQQATSTTTGITCNSRSFVIQTFTQTLAADSSLEFVVSNNILPIGNAVNIQATVVAYSGIYTTNGIPMILIRDIVSGTSFKIVVSNVHGANALSGTLLIAILIPGANNS